MMGVKVQESMRGAIRINAPDVVRIPIGKIDPMLLVNGRAGDGGMHDRARKQKSSQGTYR
jgi:hypothetical protein